MRDLPAAEFDLHWDRVWVPEAGGGGEIVGYRCRGEVWVWFLDVGDADGGDTAWIGCADGGVFRLQELSS